MKRFSVFIALFLSVSLFMGCSPRWERSPVVEQRDITVSLEHKVVRDQIVEQQFNHPFDIDLQDMETLLTRLDYIDKSVFYGEPERKPVFQENEVDRLVPALVSALARATPDQRVRFISYNRGGGLWFLKKQRKTGGVVFVERGGRLNIAFGFVNYEIRENSDLRKFPEENEFSDPLAIESCNTPIIAPDCAVHNRMQNGEEYPMWIVAEIEGIDKPAVSASEAEAGKPESAAEPEAKPAPGKESESGETVLEKKEPDHKPSDEESGDSWESRKENIKRKLEYLKELHESDLIDAEEYNHQKKKLLDRLSK